MSRKILGIAMSWNAWFITTGILIFVVCLYFGTNTAFLMVLSYGALASVAKVRWNLHRMPLFWILITIWTAIHLIFILFFQSKINVHPKIILSPLAIVDIFLIDRSMNLLLIKSRLPVGVIRDEVD